MNENEEYDATIMMNVLYERRSSEQGRRSIRGRGGRGLPNNSALRPVYTTGLPNIWMKLYEKQNEKYAQSETATKAQGLLDRFQQGSTILGLKICMTVFGPLKLLNRALQSSMANMSGMMAAVETVTDELKALQTDEHFQQ